MAATTDVAAPADEVWALVSDVTRMGEWSPETKSARWVEGDGPKPGAKFKGTNKRRISWTTTCTVESAEPGKEFTFVVGKDTRWRYTFEPTAEGCRVTESYEILKEPGAMMRFLTKLGTGVSWEERPADLERGMAETLQHLKEAAERR